MKSLAWSLILVAAAVSPQLSLGAYLAWAAILLAAAVALETAMAAAILLTARTGPRKLPT